MSESIKDDVHVPGPSHWATSRWLVPDLHPNSPSWRGTVTLSTADVPGIRSAGVDLADVGRLGVAVRRSGEGLLRRIFGDGERAWAGGHGNERTDRLAALFSVKESVVKAAGGFPSGSGYADITVGPVDALTASPVQLSGEFGHWADEEDVELLAGAVPWSEDLVLGWVVAVPGRTTR